MSKEKISSQEIIDMLASKASVSKRAAEEFLKVMISTVEEALLAGEVVKIKNFGTFKLHWNEPRKSVNVHTGEDILLAGYHKVTFVPDAILKDMVNEPFSHLEPVLLDAPGENMVLTTVSEATDEELPEPLRIFTEQANEIKNLLSEIQALSPTPKDVATSGLSLSELDLENDETEVILNDIDNENQVSPNEVVTSETDKSEPADEYESVFSINEGEEIEPVAVDDEFVVSESHTVDDRSVVDEDFIVKIRLNVQAQEPESILESIDDAGEEIIIHPEAVNPFDTETGETSDTQADGGNIVIPVNEVEAGILQIDIDDTTKPESVPVEATIVPASVPEVYTVAASDDRSVSDGANNVVPENGASNISEPIEGFAPSPFVEKIKTLNKPRKGRKRYILLGVKVFLAAFVLSLYFYFPPATRFMNNVFSQANSLFIHYRENLSMTKMMNSVTKIVTPEPKPATPEQVMVVVPKDTLDSLTQMAPEPVDSLQLLFDNPRVYDEFIATERIVRGSRLTRMSERYYGAPDFWVYIYEANMDNLSHPDSIVAGTLIRIPKLDPRLIDECNPRSVAKAKELHDLYVK